MAGVRISWRTLGRLGLVIFIVLGTLVSGYYLELWAKDDVDWESLLGATVGVLGAFLAAWMTIQADKDARQQDRVEKSLYAILTLRDAMNKALLAVHRKARTFRRDAFRRTTYEKKLGKIVAQVFKLYYELVAIDFLSEYRLVEAIPLESVEPVIEARQRLAVLRRKFEASQQSGISPDRRRLRTMDVVVEMPHLANALATAIQALTRASLKERYSGISPPRPSRVSENALKRAAIVRNSLQPAEGLWREAEVATLLADEIEETVRREV